MVAAWAFAASANGQQYDTAHSSQAEKDCAQLEAYLDSKAVPPNESALIASCAKAPEWCEDMRYLFMRNNRRPPAVFKCGSKSGR
jgi:hypothetical protein